jgi:AraC-like DNA-binding protein
MFYLCGVGLAFFLTLLLLSKSKKTVADKILAGWLLVITVHLFLFYLLKTNQYPELLGLQIPFPLLHGPFLYLYTLTLTGNKLSFKGWMLHFLPFISVALYVTPFLALSTKEKIFVFENQGIGYETFNVINGLLIMASGVGYVILTSIVLRRHRISIAHQFSSTEKINLEWLQYLVYWIGAIWIFVILGKDDLVFATAVLFVSFIGFFGIRQVGIFHSAEFSSANKQSEAPPTGSEPIKNEPIEEISEKRKYQKSGLSVESAEHLHRKLTRLMKDERLFCEGELSLSELAMRLNTQPNYLSQVINEKEGKIFYDYINTIRIEEFKRLSILPESRKYTLLALAEQCGFNSKSSFNRYFKKVTGQSPSEFMKTVRESAD